MPDPRAWFVCLPGGLPCVWTAGDSPDEAKATFVKGLGDDWKFWERNRYTCKEHRLVPVEGDGNA